MTNEEAKEQIVKLCNTLQILPNTPLGKAMIRAIEALEQKWIPTSERLPESDCETILVTGKMKYASEKEYEYFVDCAFVESIHGTPDNFSPFDFETWNDWYEGQDEYYILAWMPLPEPFKAESEE